MANRTVRFFFSNIADAADGLFTVLQDMRTTDKDYTLSGLTAQSVLQSGITLTGDIDDIVEKLKLVPTAVAYE